MSSLDSHAGTASTTRTAHHRRGSGHRRQEAEEESEIRSLVPPSRRQHPPPRSSRVPSSHRAQVAPSSSAASWEDAAAYPSFPSTTEKPTEWTCSQCTYRNNADSYQHKCALCGATPPAKTAPDLSARSVLDLPLPRGTAVGIPVKSPPPLPPPTAQQQHRTPSLSEESTSGSTTTYTAVASIHLTLAGASEATRTHSSRGEAPPSPPSKPWESQQDYCCAKTQTHRRDPSNGSSDVSLASCSTGSFHTWSSSGGGKWRTAVLTTTTQHTSPPPSLATTREESVGTPANQTTRRYKYAGPKASKSRQVFYESEQHAAGNDRHVRLAASGAYVMPHSNLKIPPSPPMDCQSLPDQHDLAARMEDTSSLTGIESLPTKSRRRATTATPYPQLPPGLELPSPQKKRTYNHKCRNESSSGPRVLRFLKKLRPRRRHRRRDI